MLYWYKKLNIWINFSLYFILTSTENALLLLAINWTTGPCSRVKTCLKLWAPGTVAFLSQTALTVLCWWRENLNPMCALTHIVIWIFLLRYCNYDIFNKTSTTTIIYDNSDDIILICKVKFVRKLTGEVRRNFVQF